MTGALLILACVAAFLAIVVGFGYALCGDIVEAITVGLIVTAFAAGCAAFLALIAFTAGHFS